MASARESFYTTDDIYALPDDQRAELIDGRMYMMSPPSTRHQKIVGNLYAAIHNYIKAKGGSCEVFPAPFAVFLNEDELNYVEPDISVVCDEQKLTDKGCNGAPDWIIEVTSPGTSRMDYGIKLFKYRSAGVREYWIVDSQKKTVMVYDLEHDEQSDLHSFEDNISSCVCRDLELNITNLLS